MDLPVVFDFFIALVIVTVVSIVLKIYCSKKSKKIPKNVRYRLVGHGERKKRQRIETKDAGYYSIHANQRALKREKRKDIKVESSFSYAHFDTAFVVSETRQQNRQRKKYHTKLMESEQDFAVKEICEENQSVYPVEAKILKVKPLTALDGDDNTADKCRTRSNQEDLVIPYLDWNKVFTFLSHQIDPKEYKIFFVHLYTFGLDLLPRGQTINNRIKNIEATNKLSTSTLLFDLFESWYSLLGDKARIHHIYEALQLTGNNEAHKHFQDFMSNPPLLPMKTSNPDVTGGQYQLVFNTRKPSLNIVDHINPNLFSQTQVMALHSDVRNENETVLQSYEANEISIQLRNQRGQTGSSSVQKKYGISKYSTRSSITSRGEKRSRSELSSLSSSNEDPIPVKARKWDIASHTADSTPGKDRRRKTARRTASICKQLVQWDKINDKTFIDLIKRFLLPDRQMLLENEYYLFVYHTVSLIIKTVRESEELVLSVLVVDFIKHYEHKSEWGHTTFIIGTKKGNMSLGEREWENLKLYAECARPRVMEKMILGNSDFVGSKYLFIGYDGEPIVGKTSSDNISKLICAPGSYTCDSVEMIDPSCYAAENPDASRGLMNEEVPSIAWTNNDNTEESNEPHSIAESSPGIYNTITSTTENKSMSNDGNIQNENVNLACIKVVDRMNVLKDNKSQNIDESETNKTKFDLNHNDGDIVKTNGGTEKRNQETYPESIDSLIENIEKELENVPKTIIHERNPCQDVYCLGQKSMSSYQCLSGETKEKLSKLNTIDKNSIKLNRRNSF